MSCGFHRQYHLYLHPRIPGAQLNDAFKRYLTNAVDVLNNMDDYCYLHFLSRSVSEHPGVAVYIAIAGIV